MRTLTNTLLGAFLGLTLAVGGCSGPNAKLGYSTIEKDGRLYLFNYNSAAYQFYQRTGDMGKSITRVGGGPNGMTVIAEPEVDIDKFMAAGL